MSRTTRRCTHTRDERWDGLVRRQLATRRSAVFRCNGCGREESECSADPCFDVIEDREHDDRAADSNVYQGEPA
jgi:hypothetical protein